MATIGNLVVNLSANTKGFRKGLDRAETRLGRFSRKLGVSEELLRRFAAAGVAAGAVFVGWGVRLAFEMETANVALRTMLGDIEKADKLVEQLSAFSAVTPFTPRELIESSRALLGFETAAEDVMNQVQLLGDVAAGSSMRIIEVVRNFGKVQATGKADLEQINQLAQRGVPIYASLKKQTGLAADELRKFISTGKVSAKIYRNVLEDMTSSTGMFFEAMKKQSATAAGKWSTFMGALEALGVEIGTDLIPIIKSMTNHLTDATQQSIALKKALEGASNVSIESSVVGIKNRMLLDSVKFSIEGPGDAVANRARLGGILGAGNGLRDRRQEAADKASQRNISQMVGVGLPFTDIGALARQSFKHAEKAIRIKDQNKFLFGEKAEDNTPIAVRVGKFLGGLSNNLTALTQDAAKKAVSVGVSGLGFDPDRKEPAEQKANRALFASSAEGMAALRQNFGKKAGDGAKRREDLAKNQLKENEAATGYLKGIKEGVDRFADSVVGIGGGVG